MKKAKFLVDTTSETILAFVLLGIVCTSFVLTNNLSNMSLKPQIKEDIMGIYEYKDTFNPLYFSNESISVKDAGLDVGGKSLNVKINSKKNLENIKIITIANNDEIPMKLNVIFDFVKLDGNSNYYLFVNDKEYLVKDSYKPAQYDIPIEIDSHKEATLSVKVKALERIDTEFNVVFSEN